MMVAAGQGGGAAWGPDGTVILGGGTGLQLLRASGEDATSLTTLAEGEINHFVPEFLPSGRAVLFTTWNGAEGQVAVHDVETAIRTNLFTGTTPRYATSGHLIFWRDSSLWAVPFDADRLEVLGDPQVVVEGVASYTQADVGAYSVSTDGTLAYLPGSDGRTLVWVDRQGQPTPFVDETADYLYPRLSPDETTAAVQIEGNIWICESGRACRPFTTNGGLFPVWTPDGTHIAFQSSRDGDPALYWKEVDGSGEAERLLAREGLQFPMSWSSDGQVLAFSDGSGGPDDIFLLPLDGEPEEYLATASREATPTFSRDGRWIAYRSDDAGQFRLYVRPYPGPGGEELVSLEAGAEPAWGGRELFFRDGARMMAVEVEDGETFGIPRLLFDGYENIDGRNYDVTSDGERFLMVMRQASAEEIHVVQNWFEELKERVPIP
jgi:serine/threonine-protein kinase